MTRPSTDRIAIGALSLEVPRDWQLLSSLESPDATAQLARASPEWTIYHSNEYLDFARKHGAPCAMLVARRGSQLLFGLPLHVRERGFTTGYAGLLLPPDAKERQLRKSVAAMFELIALNRELHNVQVMQSTQSDASSDAERWSVLDAAITCLAPLGATQPVFTRIMQLPARAPELGRATTVLEPTSGDLDGDLLASYDADLRNQIRQAERKGVRLSAHILAAGASDRDIAAAYARYLPIHAESWSRTGLEPHGESYWHALAHAIVAAGGIDLVVLANVADEAVAGVTCHIFGQHALYWSGGSKAAALPARANPLSLHAAISLSARLGVRRFELGRFSAWQDEKSESITRYKAQFGGRLIRVPNVQLERRAGGNRQRLGAPLVRAMHGASIALARVRRLIGGSDERA